MGRVLLVIDEIELVYPEASISPAEMAEKKEGNLMIEHGEGEVIIGGVKLPVKDT